MIRKILIMVVPLLAPLLTYLVWAWFTAHRREAEESGRRLPAWQQWPWAWLVITGAALTVATLFAAGLSEKRTIGTDYSPARYEDGELIPGEFSDTEEREGVGVDRRPDGDPTDR